MKSNLEKYKHEGDDSSDEELEASIYSRPLQVRHYTTLDTQLHGIRLLTHEEQDLDLKWSLILQDLGMRILISDSVRSLYFPYKTKLGEFDKLPDDENIRSALKKAITKSLQKYPNSINDVLESEYYTELLEELLADKRKIFSLSKDVMSNLLKSIKDAILVQPQSVSSTLEELCSRRVEQSLEAVKKQLPNDEKKQLFSPKKGLLRIGQEASSNLSSVSIETEIAGVNLENIFKKTYKDCCTLQEKITEPQFIARMKQMVLDEIEDRNEERLGLDWLVVELEGALKTEIHKFQNALERPTLPDTTSFSPKDISNEARYSIPEKLFCYLRLIHCSAKRFIKNTKTIEDFDGACFSRGWQFDDESPLAAIQMQFISSGRTLKTMAQYPYKSDYVSLKDKLESLQSKMGISHGKLVECIRAILMEGKITDTTLYEKPYFETFERFLNVFTFHLFVTEVERHPAAIIHNIMALDLVETQEDWGFIANLPMAIEGAVPVVRAIQYILHKKLSLPYYYDASRTQLNGPEDGIFQDFIMREEAIVLKWLESKKLTSEITAGFIEQINTLCTKYYGISLISDQPIKELLNKAFSSHSDANENIIIPNGFSDVPSDGLCFYHAIARQLNNSYTAHDIQNMARDHILQNPAYYKEFINGLGIPGITDQLTSLEAIETYINHHLGHNTWADHLMIQAVANALSMSINVHMFNANGNHQVYEDGARAGEEVIMPFIPQGTAIRALTVGNIGNLHFVTQEVIIAEPQAELQLEAEENIPASNDLSDSSELIGLASLLDLGLNLHDSNF